MKESQKSASSFLFILACSLLFLGFYRNQWHMARPKQFSSFQKDVEAYVIGRMVLTRQSGLLSNGGLLGWGDVDGTRMNNIGEVDYQHQFDTYLKGLTFYSYLAKESHPGFQGIFFSALDRISPLNSFYNLRLFRLFTAGGFAIVLSGVILWFFLEFGWLPALFVLISILISQWMTLFGRNLFFVSGLFYLPMLLLLFQLRRERTGRQLSQGNLFWLVFSTILLKCLFNGYDFILPTLCMAASPLIYYSLRDRWDSKTLAARFMITVLASLAAILVSLAILTLQVALASGSFVQGIEYIFETLNRRTLGNDPNLPSIYAQARNASTWSILKIYLSESYFYKLQVPYFVFIFLFGIISLAQLRLERLQPSRMRLSSNGVALVAVTWFSLLGPLSWYVLFKSIAYFHTHMNYLPWHMPFTLFGFGLCGYFMQSLFMRLSGMEIDLAHLRWRLRHLRISQFLSRLMQGKNS